MIYKLTHINWLTPDDIVLTDNSRPEHQIFTKDVKNVDKVRLMLCEEYTDIFGRKISTFHFIRYVVGGEVSWMYCFYEKRRDIYYVTLKEKIDDNQLLFNAYKIYDRDEKIDKLLE